jgi:hypothetical protein
MKFAVYEQSTGRLMNHYDAPNPQEQCMPGQCVVEGWPDQQLFWVADSEIVPRQPHPCQIDKTSIHANGLDEITIAAVRPGSDVTIYGPIGSSSPITETHRVDDGEIAISLALPGEYTISIQCFPLLDWEVSVHAD